MKKKQETYKCCKFVHDWLIKQVEFDDYSFEFWIQFCLSIKINSETRYNKFYMIYSEQWFSEKHKYCSLFNFWLLCWFFCQIEKTADYWYFVTWYWWFFFVWNERDFQSESLLKTYSIDKLCDTDMLTVKTNISFYNFFIKSDSKCVEYFLSLYNIYVFSKSISNFISLILLWIDWHQVITWL